MTIVETIKGYPGLADLTSAMIEKVCIDRGISQVDTYAATLKTTVNLTIADALMAKANDPNFTENDLTVNQSQKLIESANRLYSENGEGYRVKSQPVIRTRTNLW